MKDELAWLTTHRQDLVEKHRGQWVVIDSHEEKVFAADNLTQAVSKYKQHYPTKEPHVFKIPTLDQQQAMDYGIFL